MKRIWPWLLLFLFVLANGNLISCQKQQPKKNTNQQQTNLLNNRNPMPTPFRMLTGKNTPPVAPEGLNASPLNLPDVLKKIGAKSATPIAPLRRTIVLDEPGVQQRKIILDKSGSDYTFLTERTTLLYPVDYKIGPLQELTGKDKEQQSLISIITRFFNALIKGNVEKELLYKENATTLLGFLNFNLKNQKDKLTRFRIGKIDIKTEAAQVNIRLYSSKGVTEGEIFFINTENTWLISDLQVNFELLAVEHKESADKFLPGTYYWMLKNK